VGRLDGLDPATQRVGLKSNQRTLDLWRTLRGECHVVRGDAAAPDRCDDPNLGKVRSDRANDEQMSSAMGSQATLLLGRLGRHEAHVSPNLVSQSAYRREARLPPGDSQRRAASHILVIDDDRDLCFVIEEMLRAEGYKVSVAHDDDQGIKLQRKQPASLLITDIFTPNKEGVETIRDFREEFPNMPIIAMSGGGRPRSRAGRPFHREGTGGRDNPPKAV
jgi:CheY-like chemotaxis protein